MSKLTGGSERAASIISQVIECGVMPPVDMELSVVTKFNLDILAFFVAAILLLGYGIRRLGTFKKTKQKKL